VNGNELHLSSGADADVRKRVKFVDEEFLRLSLAWVLIFLLLSGSLLSCSWLLITTFAQGGVFLQGCCLSCFAFWYE
jgi:hypothetical protein